MPFRAPLAADILAPPRHTMPPPPLPRYAFHFADMRHTLRCRAPIGIIFRQRAASLRR
jgi:hypothetical protein